MTQAISNVNTAATRPPAFGVDPGKPASTAIDAAVAKAIATSTFIFDARVAKGDWPMPPMSDVAREVLSRMLAHAASLSPQYGRIHYEMEVAPHEGDRVDSALKEILGFDFAMPVEGGTHSVPTIDAAALCAGRLLYSLGDTYAAYLGSLGATIAPEISAEADNWPAALIVRGGAIVVDDGELKLLVTGLQSLHNQRVMAWNFHAVEALRDGRKPEAPMAFGIPSSLAMLHKLGAQPGGGGF